MLESILTQMSTWILQTKIELTLDKTPWDLKKIYIFKIKRCQIFENVAIVCPKI